MNIVDRDLYVTTFASFEDLNDDQVLERIKKLKKVNDYTTVWTYKYFFYDRFFWHVYDATNCKIYNLKS